MALPAKPIAKALGTLTEEVVETATSVAPKRSTYSDVQTSELRKARTEDKVEEIQGVQTREDITATESVLDDGVNDAFVGVREQDIASQQSYANQQYRKKSEQIGRTDDELELDKLYEQRRDIYLRADKLSKERVMTDRVKNSVNGKEGLYDIISNSAGKGSGHTNVEARSTSLYNRFSSGMTELKDEFRTKWAGLSQNLELMNETVRFMKDGKVRNKAMEADARRMADQWTKTAEEIKNLRNQAGAKIGKLEDWIIPQSHDKMKIRRAGYKGWRKTIIDKLDVKRIESEQNKDIESVLQTAYKNIIAPDVEKGRGAGGNIAKRQEESRVLHFNNGDDIINYNKDFGNPDFFGTMDAHMRGQSQDISMMQLFGANPDETFEKLKELARADGSLGSIAETKLDAVWNVVSGKTDGDNVVTKLDNFVAQTGGVYRSIQVASKLGSATISALADVSNIMLGSGYRGVSAMNIMGTTFKTLFEGSVGTNTKLASRIGIVSEFANASLANSRFADNVGSGLAQKSAETVIRASGLGKYTESLRVAVGLEFSANIAESLNKNFNDVPFKSMLEEYGIDETAWKAMRGKTKSINKSGAKADFFDVTQMYDGVNDELGYRVSEMITNEMDAFVIMPNARTRAWTTAGGTKGSVKGELARNMMLFKSFPVAVTLMHLNRFKHLSGADKVMYGGAVITANTVIGGMTLMAYDVATGKTPRDPARPAMIGEALAKGGGLGVFGDFFIGLKDTKYNTSFSDIILGVPASTLNDITRLSQDMITKDGWGKTENVWNTAKNYIPGQNLWYTRLAVEKSIGNYISEALDPKFEDRQRRRRKAMNLRNQEPLEEVLF